MACICEKLHELDDFVIPSDKIWSHLETLYNLEALNEIESMPFPNDEKEFMLPDVEYGLLKSVKKEDKVEEKNGKSVVTKRSDGTKEVIKSTSSKEVKKEEKVVKKEMPRRDSKDGKDLKMNVGIKKEVKKETGDNKTKNMKCRSSSSKEEEKAKTPNRLEEIKRLQNKRPTRASISIKPEEINLRKSQSPLTIAANTSNKRRRI